MTEPRPHHRTFDRRLLALLLGAWAADAAWAEPAVRLADLVAGAGSGVPTVHAVVFQDKLYFRASDDGTSFDLWVYDGANPPAPVPGSEGVDPLDPVVFQGAIYFRGVDGGDAELWRFDGVNPPAEAIDLRAVGSGDPRELFAWEAAGLLCYQVSTASGVELGCWDGAGTPVVHELGAAFGSGFPTDFALLGDLLVLGADTGNLQANRRLFAFDGANPPVLVAFDGTHPSNPREMTVADGVVYFWATAPGAVTFRVWKWNGTAPPEPFGPTNVSSPGAMALWRGRPHLYVGQNPAGLWRVEADALTRLSDGTGGLSGGSALAATVAGDAIYLVSGTTDPGQVDLHRYCGGDALPVVAPNFSTVNDGVVRSRTLEFAGRLYFAAQDAAAGSELWSIPLDNILCDGFGDGGLSNWSAAIGVTPP